MYSGRCEECFFSLGVLKYVVCLCKGCDGCCDSVCIVTRGAVGARVVFRHADVCVAMSVSFCLPHSVAVSAFIMCSVLVLRCCKCEFWV